MWVYINTEVADKLGFASATILEHFFMLNPHNDKAKLNVSNLSEVLPLSLSTAQRSVKELVEQNYLIKHSRNVYSFSTRFFSEFSEYKHKFLINGRTQ